MKRTFAYGAVTKQGTWPVQEDGFFANPGAGLFAVADGFGGQGKGNFAAKLALQECQRLPAAAAGGAGGIFSPAQRSHAELFREANKKLLQWNEKRTPATRGGTSLILATVDRDRGWVVSNCGACSAFVLRQGAWFPLLTPQAAPRSDVGASLLPFHALGLAAEIPVETRSLFWEAGDLLFLFSGGVAGEQTALQTALAGQAAMRLPGTDLHAVVALASESDGITAAAWNQTALVVEALAGL